MVKGKAQTLYWLEFQDNSRTMAGDVPPGMFQRILKWNEIKKPMHDSLAQPVNKPLNIRINEKH